jgi:uncharacterized protein YfaP (DUF2135 family)
MSRRSWLLLALLSSASPGPASGQLTNDHSSNVVEREPPKVKIKAPRPGWTHQRVVAVQGTVSDVRLREAFVALNGVERPISVRDGRFEVKLVVPPGEDTLEVSARNEAGAGHDSVSFYAAVPPTDVVVMLGWDTDGTDLDLHVTDPGGEECDFGNRRTAAGGALEVDDVDGYGPEIFAQPKALPGTYRVAVAAYELNGVPETHAEVQVLVRQGTSAERRYRFEVTFTREGENVEVGTFRVDPLGR